MAWSESDIRRVSCGISDWDGEVLPFRRRGVVCLEDVRDSGAFGTESSMRADGWDDGASRDGRIGAGLSEENEDEEVEEDTVSIQVPNDPDRLSFAG